MTIHHVMLLGGHGKVARHLTPLLLQRSWKVSSVIHNPEQIPTLEKLGENTPGKLDVVVRDLVAIQDEAEAKAFIEEVKPVYIVWSAGAGEGPRAVGRTLKVDRDSCTKIINAAVATPTITKFLMISYLAPQRAKPSWWDDESWENVEHTNSNLLPNYYYKAEVAADEALHVAAKKRGPGFAGICLRPGSFNDEPAGNAELGKVKTAAGFASREATARVAVLLLEA